MSGHCPVTGVNIPRFTLAVVAGFAFIFGCEPGQVRDRAGTGYRFFTHLQKVTRWPIGF